MNVDLFVDINFNENNNNNYKIRDNFNLKIIIISSIADEDESDVIILKYNKGSIIDIDYQYCFNKDKFKSLIKKCIKTYYEVAMDISIDSLINLK